MYRIKQLLGLMLASFSVVFMLFGIVLWHHRGADTAEILVCFLFASIQLGGSIALFTWSSKDYHRECGNLDYIIMEMIHHNHGKVGVRRLAGKAGISEEDAREYLVRCAKRTVCFKGRSPHGDEEWLFPQRWWNN